MPALRKNLLNGQIVAVSGPGGAVLIRTLAELGASAEPFAPNDEDQAGITWARKQSPLHALVHDATPAFGDGDQDGLLRTLELAWSSIAAIANGALVPAQAGKVVLIAPRTGAGRHAEPAGAAIENLARTLSVEWARYGITTTAIAPSESTSDEQVAMLVGYLLSHAGGYFSGCRFRLGAVAA